MDTFEKLLNLISENESIDGLLSELTDGRNPIQLEALSNPTFTGLQSLIEEQSRLTGSPVCDTSANILCSVIKSSFAKHEQKLYLDSSDDRAKLHIIINVGRHFISCNKFSSRVFAKIFNKKDESYIPFEVIWMLHKSSIMTLDFFLICNVERTNVINNMSSHMGSLCCLGDNDIDLRQSMLLDVVRCLLKFSFPYNDVGVVSRGMKKVSQALLDNILKKILSLKEKKQDVNMFAVFNQTLLQQQQNNEIVFPSRNTLKKFYLRQASVVLTRKNDEGFSFDLFANHQKWTFVNMNKNLRYLFEELLVLIKEHELISLVEKLLEQNELDWKNGLMLISVALVCFPTFSVLIEGLSIKMFQKSLQSNDSQVFASNFLLMRHCCTQGQHIYFPYHVWFKKLFKEEGWITLNKKYFSFILKILTEIVPHESEEFIKVHIQNPPSGSYIISSKSREEWFDYLALAKTHLSVIKTDDVSATEEVQQEMTIKAEKEIEAALESFQKDHKIPSFIIEMTLFCRPYFLGKFLPILLRPRLLPSMPDNRMRLVSALHESHKIPSSMIQKYESECKRMALELVDGVIVLDEDGNDIDDDDDMLVLQLPLLEQLKVSLNSMENSVQSEKKFLRYLSDVSEKLNFITKKCISSPSGFIKGIDLNDFQLSSSAQLCQASHLILEFILRMTFLDKSKTEHLHLDWLDKLMMMLKNHKEILGYVYRIAGSLIANKSNHLSPCHLIGLSNLLSQRIHANSEIYGEIMFNKMNFFNYIEEIVKFKNVKHLERIVSLVCYYVVLVKNKYGELVTNTCELGAVLSPITSGKGYIPQEFIDILLYGLQKLNPRLRSSEADDIITFIEGTQDECLKLVFKMIFDEKLAVFDKSLSFKKWMKYEFELIDASLGSSVSNDYFMWAVHSGKFVLSEDLDEERSTLEKYCMEIFEFLCSWDAMTSSECFECCIDLKQRKDSKFLSFVYLLQNLACQSSTKHDTLPWLWVAIDRVLGHSINDQDSKNEGFSELLASKKIVKLLTMLPPALIVSNSSSFMNTSCTSTTKGLVRMTSFINSNLRNISECILTLDFNLTLHILQGLSHITSLNLKDFFIKCPLYTFSIFNHWSCIQISEVYKKEPCSLKNIFHQIINLYSSLTTTLTGSLSSKMSAAVFMGLQKDHLEAFNICIEMSSSIHQAIFSTNKINAFIPISSKFETSPDLFVKVYKFNRDNKLSIILRLSLPDLILSLWSSALMSIFVQLVRKRKFCHNSDFINSVLENYKDFNTFFEMPDLDHSVLYSQSFITIGEASQAMVEYLEKLPSNCLKDIDKEILNNSDILVQSIVNRHR